MSLFFFKDCIYLLIRDTERERERERERQAETQGEGEAGSMQGPDLGLHPGSPGSCPRLQAVLNTEPPGAAQIVSFVRSEAEVTVPQGEGAEDLLSEPV